MGNGRYILGPVIVNYMRDYQLGLGLPREQVYNQTMLILAGLLMIGLVCNLLIRPVAEHWFMTPEELALEKQHLQDKVAEDTQELLGDDNATVETIKPTPLIKVYLAWILVAIPSGWGIYNTLVNAAKFFS